MRLLKGSVVILLFVVAVSCSKDQEIRLYSFSFLFKDSLSGWEGGFADYPEDSTGYHLNAGLDTLPYEINTDSTKKGIRISGINQSDDLFMFIKRKIPGLQKNATYEVLFNIRLASNAPTGAAGVGGAPGESVYLKVGASSIEPESQLTDGFNIMNIDKGNQSGGGENMIVVGHIGVAATTTKYAVITRFNSSGSGVRATANDAGELWVIVGTDSGFEGETTLYYTQVDVFLNAIN